MRMRVQHRINATGRQTRWWCSCQREGRWAKQTRTQLEFKWHKHVLENHGTSRRHVATS